jgi:hypothetical protein
VKRRTRTILVFLLLGAIVNVAVAWGCARFCNVRQFSRTSSEEDVQWWAHDGPIGVTHPLTALAASQSRGLRVVLMVYETRIGQDYRLWTQNLAVGYQAGLPLLSMHGENWVSGLPRSALLGGSFTIGPQPTGMEKPRYAIKLYPDPSLTHSRLLPLKPIWPGFAINTVFYAAILWLLFAAPFALRRRRRIKRCLCPKCAYPVGTSEVCTECGAAVMPTDRRMMS